MFSSEHKTSPQDFFLNISAFGALYCLLVSFGAIVCGAIDILASGQSDSAGLANALAFFVVLLPICLALFSHIEKSYRTFPNRRGSRVRRWLVALTLFLAGSVGVCVAIGSLSALFQGDMQSADLAKVLFILAEAAGTFLLFLSEIRSFRSD